MPFRIETLVLPLAAVVFSAMVGHSKSKVMLPWVAGLVFIAVALTGSFFFNLQLEYLITDIAVLWVAVAAGFALITRISTGVFASTCSVSVAGCLLIYPGYDLSQWIFAGFVLSATIVANRQAYSKKGFVHLRVADEALLILLILLFATTSIPAIMAGWQSAELLNREALADGLAEIDIAYLILLLLFVAGVGAAFQWRRAKRLFKQLGY